MNLIGCFFKVFTSISVSDNIDKGISTFMGELLRIKKAIDYNKENKLVLVDEIFKGTNYSDRIYGANEVIKNLIMIKLFYLLLLMILSFVNVKLVI